MAVAVAVTATVNVNVQTAVCCKYDNDHERYCETVPDMSSYTSKLPSIKAEQDRKAQGGTGHGRPR